MVALNEQFHQNPKTSRVPASLVRTLFETTKPLLMNAWAGNNPGLLADVPIDSS